MKIDANALLAKIKAGQASTTEMEQGLAIVKAVDAAEDGSLSPEQETLLKSCGLVDEEEPDPAPPPAAAAPPAAGAAGTPADASAITKAADNLGEGPDDLPEPGDLMRAIAEAGGQPAQQAVNVAPVLQAGVATYDRVAKAMEELTVGVLAQNQLLAQLVPLAATVDTLQKGLLEQATILKAMQAGGTPIQKSAGEELGLQLAEALRRVGAVETVLNNTAVSGNPPRSNALGKALPANGDLTYYGAIGLVQKSALPDYEKGEALGTLQLAVDLGRPFADVLRSYDLLPTN